uniref:Uncharacterized protein n=1 Tax=Oryza punctata TaxID=4537 RepID=A0A0E0K9L9_ORYPU
MVGCMTRRSGSAGREDLNDEQRRKLRTTVTVLACISVATGLCAAAAQAACFPGTTTSLFSAGAVEVFFFFVPFSLYMRLMLRPCLIEDRHRSTLACLVAVPLLLHAAAIAFLQLMGRRDLVAFAAWSVWMVDVAAAAALGWSAIRFAMAVSAACAAVAGATVAYMPGAPAGAAFGLGLAGLLFLLPFSSLYVPMLRPPVDMSRPFRCCMVATTLVLAALYLAVLFLAGTDKMLAVTGFLWAADVAGAASLGCVDFDTGQQQKYGPEYWA